LVPYSKDNDVFSGFFSSRPAYKRQIKEASALFHLHNDLFSKLVMNPSASDSEVQEILKAKTEFEDILSILNDQKSITG
jgi:hypothetical protein